MIVGHYLLSIRQQCLDRVAYDLVNQVSRTGTVGVLCWLSRTHKQEMMMECETLRTAVYRFSLGVEEACLVTRYDRDGSLVLVAEHDAGQSNALRHCTLKDKCTVHQGLK